MTMTPRNDPAADEAAMTPRHVDAVDATAEAIVRAADNQDPGLPAMVADWLAHMRRPEASAAERELAYALGRHDPADVTLRAVALARRRVDEARAHELRRQRAAAAQKFAAGLGF